MSALLVGYPRCSPEQQDLSAQRDALAKLDRLARSLPDARDIADEH